MISCDGSRRPKPISPARSTTPGAVAPEASGRSLSDRPPFVFSLKATFRALSVAFSVAPSSKGFLLRDDAWAYIQYAEDASQGVELYDMKNDPRQFHNLAGKPESRKVVDQFKEKMAAKLKEVRANDLGKK